MATTVYDLSCMPCCQTGCCDPPATNLTWEISASCSAINGATGVATFVSGDGSNANPYRWEDNSTVVGSCGTIQIVLLCRNDNYEVSVTLSSGLYDGGPADTQECNPTLVVMTVNNQADYSCCGSGMSTYTITFTE